jgi:hypothetical protein
MGNKFNIGDKVHVKIPTSPLHKVNGVVITFNYSKFNSDFIYEVLFEGEDSVIRVLGNSLELVEKESSPRTHWYKNGRFSDWEE